MAELLSESYIINSVADNITNVSKRVSCVEEDVFNMNEKLQTLERRDDFTAHAENVNDIVRVYETMLKDKVKLEYVRTDILIYLAKVASTWWSRVKSLFSQKYYSATFDRIVVLNRYTYLYFDWIFVGVIYHKSFSYEVRFKFNGNHVSFYAEVRSTVTTNPDPVLYHSWPYGKDDDIRPFISECDEIFCKSHIYYTTEGGDQNETE